MSDFDAKQVATELLKLCASMIKAPFKTINTEVAKNQEWRITLKHQALPLLAMVAVMTLIFKIIAGTPFSIIATLFEPILGVASIFVLSFIMDKLTPKLGGNPSLDKLFTVNFLALIPTFIASVVIGAVPVLALFGFFVLLYSIYIVYITAGQQVNISKNLQKGILVVVSFLLMMVITGVVSQILPQHPVDDIVYNSMPK